MAPNSDETFPGRPTHLEVETAFFRILQRKFAGGTESVGTDHHRFIVGDRSIEYVRATGAQFVVRYFEKGVKLRHSPWVLSDEVASNAAWFAAAFLSGLEDLQRKYGYEVETWLEPDGDDYMQVMKFPNGVTARRPHGALTFVEDHP